MKRSSHVALLLMGVTGVGAAGYMTTRPPPDCVQAGTPAAAAPAVPGRAALEPCPPARSWLGSGRSYGGSDRYTRTNSTRTSWWPIFSRSRTSATPSRSAAFTGSRSSASGIASRGSTTSRSGFGSTSRSFFRFSGS